MHTYMSTSSVTHITQEAEYKWCMVSPNITDVPGSIGASEHKDMVLTKKLTSPEVGK